MLRTLEGFDKGTEMPSGAETLAINTLIPQWDLSSVASPAPDCKAALTGVQRGRVHSDSLIGHAGDGLRRDGDVHSVAVSRCWV